MLNSKNENIRDEKTLREILKMKDYQVEFARYSQEGLPVCGISFEEAVDFFLNFDKKSFDNPPFRIQKRIFYSFL